MSLSVFLQYHRLQSGLEFWFLNNYAVENTNEDVVGHTYTSSMSQCFLCMDTIDCWSCYFASLM